jgi:hypothetical protein
MTKRFGGGCQCGAVRYETAAEPLFAIHCYCRQCQRITGAGHSSQLALRFEGLDIRGALSYYKLGADSGNIVTSAFCPACGSPIYKRSSGYPDFAFFHASTLDDPSQFHAQRSVWTAERQPWDNPDPSLPIE